MFSLRLIPLLLISFYLVFGYLLELPGIGMYDSKRVLQLTLFTILALLFIYTLLPKKNKQNYIQVSQKSLVLFCAFFSIGFISAILSKYPAFAFTEVLLFVVICLSAILISEQSVKRHYELGQIIYGTALLFSLIYLIIFAGNYIAAQYNPLVPMWPDRLAVSIQIGDTLHSGKEVLHFGHKRFFNHLQTWTLPLIVSTVLYFKNKRFLKILLLCLCALWWMLIFASGARGTIVAFCISCLILGLIFRQKSVRFIVISIGSALTGFLLYYLLFQIMQPSESLPVVRMGDSGRLDMWMKAILIWISNPILGAGPLHYAVLESTPYFAHPHNFYLQILAEWGLIALICVVLSFINATIFLKKNIINSQKTNLSIGSRNRTIYLGILGSAIAGLSHAGVSGVFHTPMSQVWAILIFSWLASLYFRKNNGHQSIQIRKKSISLIMLPITVGLLLIVYPQIDKLESQKEKYRQEFDQHSLYPRIWHQGLIYESSELRNGKYDE